MHPGKSPGIRHPRTIPGGSIWRGNRKNMRACPKIAERSPSPNWKQIGKHCSVNRKRYASNCSGNERKEKTARWKRRKGDRPDIGRGHDTESVTRWRTCHLPASRAASM